MGRQLLTESPDLISEVGHSKIWRLEEGRGGARQLQLFPQWLEVGELSCEDENDFPDFSAHTRREMTRSSCCKDGEVTGKLEISE